MILRETRKFLVLKIAHGALIGLKVSGGTATKGNAEPDDVTEALDPPGVRSHRASRPKQLRGRITSRDCQASITETRHIQQRKPASTIKRLILLIALSFPSNSHFEDLSWWL